MFSRLCRRDLILAAMPKRGMARLAAGPVSDTAHVRRARRSPDFAAHATNRRSPARLGDAPSRGNLTFRPLGPRSPVPAQLRKETRLCRLSLKRETVHREGATPLREDLKFRAAYNQRRHELQAAYRARLLAMVFSHDLTWEIGWTPRAGARTQPFGLWFHAPDLVFVGQQVGRTHAWANSRYRLLPCLTLGNDTDPTPPL